MREGNAQGLAIAFSRASFQRLGGASTGEANCMKRFKLRTLRVLAFSVWQLAFCWLYFIEQFQIDGRN